MNNDMSCSKSKEMLCDFLNTVVVQLNSVVDADHREPVLNLKYGTSQCCQNEERTFYHNNPLAVTRRTGIQLLHTKLLQQKWGDVVVLLLGLMRVNWKEHKFTTEKRLEQILWRVGVETILQHPHCVSDPKDHLSAYNRILGSFCDQIDQVHVLLEHNFILLCQQNFETARKGFQQYDTIERSIIGINVKQNRAKKIAFWSDTMEGYLGMVEYILWKVAVSQYIVEHQPSLEDPQCEKANLAKSALQHFEKITDKPGTWDIFVSKHVEILCYYEKYEEAREMLCSYSSSHMDNPNAHKYLYQFLAKHCDVDVPRKDVQFLALNSLFSVAPSDALCLKLHDLYFEMWLQSNPSISSYMEFNPTSDLYHALEVLFTLLDYQIWHTDIRPWKRLQEAVVCLEELWGCDGCGYVVKTIWKDTERDQWWPNLFFRHIHESNELNSIKSSIVNVCSIKQ
uniref:TATA box-binding protein-associated factor RNA polymerase I subunit A n=1 Tax=Phallusia mammillata TaxID=59560 RepID=A0A6F9DTN7_9ASCI|nr:TATA box-binding protein-associated factor RNA polymerase I subunit A [Phallusia mammillata]